MFFLFFNVWKKGKKNLIKDWSIEIFILRKDGFWPKSYWWKKVFWLKEKECRKKKVKGKKWNQRLEIFCNIKIESKFPFTLIVFNWLSSMARSLTLFVSNWLSPMATSKHFVWGEVDVKLVCPG